VNRQQVVDSTLDAFCSVFAAGFQLLVGFGKAGTGVLARVWGPFIVGTGQ